MKKIALLLVGALLLVACSKQAGEGKFTIEAVTSEANTSAFFEYSIKLPTLSGSPELKAFNTTLRQAINEERDQLKKSAKEQQNSEGFHPYQYYVDYQVVSSNVINSNSLLLSNYQYLGGANGMEMFKSFNFIDGKEVTWDTVFESNAEAIVVDLIKNELALDKLLPEEKRSYFDDAQVDNLLQTSWYVDDTMLTIAFPLFSIAPHSAGIIYMHFPVTTLIKQNAIKPIFITEAFLVQGQQNLY